ncbi:MAG: hypothetical protein VYA54_01205 [Bdellovibrionota bacterium]|nr:hypothetical protein [Bdellovibrionota bacterium]
MPKKIKSSYLFKKLGVQKYEYEIRKNAKEANIIIHKTGLDNGLDDNFKHFATKLKRKTLNKFNHQNIKWFLNADLEGLGSNCLFQFKMNFINDKYTDPKWEVPRFE